MSSPHNTPPRATRLKHQHSKSATQAQPHNNGKQSQRRYKGNRVNSGSGDNNVQYRNGRADGNQLLAPQDNAFNDSAVLSSEEVLLSSGPRNTKKHTQSQPSSDRIFSPTNIPVASLTDSEAAPNNPSATPAKAQAYAGPTFHASPAPSALPIPKFLSKSVPAKSQPGPPTPPEEGSDCSSSPTPSPPSPSYAPVLLSTRYGDSPLDVLFRADRAEKARNVNDSPASPALSNSPNGYSGKDRPAHTKQYSQSSLNTVFSAELDTESKVPLPSPPSASPIGQRSITAPSKIPQVHCSRSDPAIQDLLNRLVSSQMKPEATTPPKSVERIPSEPSSRNHTPSPFDDGKSAFRSASGPATPAPLAQESPNFYYGNRNLTPLFKGAKSESAKRNSGLRTEITADSPIMLRDGFPPVNATRNMDANSVSRAYLGNVVAPNDRRGSLPHIQPYKEMPNNRKGRTLGRAFHPRPDSYPNGNIKLNRNSKPATVPKSSMSSMAFIPSSVQAKKHSTSTSNSTPTKSPPDTSSMESMEQDLKRLLNLTVPRDVTEIR